MKETGKMIYKMDMVLKVGQMGLNMKDVIKLVKNMAKEHIPGLMVLNM